MNLLLRCLSALMLLTVVACGGGDSSGAASSGDAQASAQRVVGTRSAAPEGAVASRLDARLRGVQGVVNVWVSLEQNSVAAQRAAPLPGWNNQVVFISDGNPNQQTGTGGNSLADSTATAWNNFIDSNGITVTTSSPSRGRARTTRVASAILTPSATFAVESSMSSAVSLAAAALRSARLRTS